MIPFVYLGYSNGTSIPKESFIREKLSEFGTIVSVLMRPSYNVNVKSFVLVEFSSVVGVGDPGRGSEVPQGPQPG